MPEDTLRPTITDDRFEQVLAELLQAEERGGRPDLSAVLRTNPELEIRLRQFFQNRQGFDRLAPQLAPTATHPGVPASRPELPVGSEIDSYQVISELGRGGRGVVFRVSDPELKRPLAVKVLRLDLLGEADAERRFLEEAQVTGQLQHPGIVPVHAIGRLADGRPYFAMKLVQGRTLAPLLAERPAPADRLPQFLGIFQQICEAVAYAHSRGVIHRDLKPSNVMVGAFGEVQVMDWGLAKVLTAEGASREPPGGGRGVATPAGADTIRTVRTEANGHSSADGLVVGTFAYMSPEQATGQVEHLDPRADVFGLGAVLCEVLTGLPPYAGDTTAKLHVMAAAGDLADAFARLDRCGADAELIALARDCLAPECGCRPRDAGVVTARVATHIAGVQERLRRAELERAAAQARAQEERKRRRVILALAAAVLAVVAVGAGGGLLLQRQADRREADQARREAEQRQAVDFALQNAAALSQLARWREAQALLEQARQGLGEAGPDDLRRRLDVAQRELALVNHLDGIRQRRASWVDGHFDNETAAHDYAAAFRDAGLGQLGDDEAAVAARVRATGVAGLLVAALDDWASVAQDARSRLWLLGVGRRAAPDPWGDRLRDPALWQGRDRDALHALADEVLRDGGARLGELSPEVLAGLGLVLGSVADAVPLLRAAQLRYPNDFWLNLDLAYTLARTGREDDALGYSQVAVALRPDSAVAHNNLGNGLARKKDLDGAIAELKKAIELDPNFAFAHNNLGNALYHKGNVDEAITEFRRALALDSRNAACRANLGDALQAKKDFDGAMAEYSEAMKLDSGLASAHSGTAYVLYERGDLPGAITELSKAIDRDPRSASYHYNLGECLHRQGKLDLAIAAYKKAIDLDPGFAKAHTNLGIALSEIGESDGAFAEFRKAIDLDPKLAPAHHCLAMALRDKADLDGAVAEYRKAIEIEPDHAESHCNLGLVLREQGHFLEALAELRHGDALGRRLSGWPYPSPAWVAECEPLAAVEKRLPAVLAGNAEPADAAEALALGILCRRYRRHAAATRFYAQAFVAHPWLVADLREQHGYNAACSAALAAAGQGEDARQLPDKVRSMLRSRAIDWLRTALAAWSQIQGNQNRWARAFVERRLQQWQANPDLSGVRDLARLVTMPDAERQAWQKLWADVEALQNGRMRTNRRSSTPPAAEPSEQRPFSSLVWFISRAELSSSSRLSR
jgi:serine/threonine-protein kinase